MTVLSYRIPYKPSFQRLELLTLSSQYILFLMSFLSQNLGIYTFNSTISGFYTRKKLQLHTPSTTLKIYQKGALCDSIKIFNKLAKYIAKYFLRKKYCISNLKKYLIDKPFYSLEEYMNS
jgi:hypothetical protein